MLEAQGSSEKSHGCREVEKERRWASAGDFQVEHLLVYVSALMLPLRAAGELWPAPPLSSRPPPYLRVCFLMFLFKILFMVLEDILPFNSVFIVLIAASSLKLFIEFSICSFELN